LTSVKRFSVIVICAVIAAVAGTAVCGGYASASDPSGFEELQNIGYDLGDYQASLTYYSCTMNTAGVCFAFEVILDSDFLLKSSTVEGNVLKYPDILAEFEKLFQSIGYKTELNNNGELLAYLYFDSMTDYYVASGRNGYELPDPSENKKSGFLFTEYYSTSETVFAAVDSGEGIVSRIFDGIVALGADKDKILLKYVYGTPYKTISTDADEKKYDYNQGIYLHSFNMNLSNKDREIHLTNRSPNAWGFYLLAVIAAVIVIAVPLTVCIVKLKKKKEEQISG